MNLALIGIATLSFSLNCAFAQTKDYEKRIQEFNSRLQEFNVELEKMNQKVDSLSNGTVRKEIKEVIVTEDNGGDSVQTRKKITLIDDTPGKQIKVDIYDAQELTKEQEKEILENLQSLRGLESLSSLGNLFNPKSSEALKMPENSNGLTNIEKKIEKFESTMTSELNDLTDKLAELEMEYSQMRKEVNGDTTTIRLGTSKIVIIEDENQKNNSIHWQKEKSEEEDKEIQPKERDKVEFSTLGLSLGLNTFMYKGNTNLPVKYSNLELDALRSWNVNLKLLEAKISLINHQLNLLTGVGIDWNNYRFRNNINLSPRTDTLLVTRDTINFKKNKLMSQTLMGHMMLQFETKPGKNGRTFDIGAGVFGGYLLNARTKQVSDARGKSKFDDDFQLDSFRYGICGRIGYGAFDLYVNYTLNDIFRPNLGPSVQNLSFGLNFTGL